MIARVVLHAEGPTMDTIHVEQDVEVDSLEDAIDAVPEDVIRENVDPKDVELMRFEVRKLADSPRKRPRRA